MRLKELHINNFKFFPKQDPQSPLLKIDGKNLLIYGENGSGKSTIYWALYTLLESSFKDSDAKVSKYFTKGGDQSLINIFSPRNDNAHIKAVLADDVNTKEYLVSGNLTTIQAIRTNSAVRESSMASDFINYRVLFKLHHPKHTSNNNLFSWFEDEILPYIRKTAGADTFKKRVDKLRHGPKRVKNIEGEWVYPNPSMATETNEAVKDAVQKDFRWYRQWRNGVLQWQRDTKVFLREITDKANTILEDDFKQPLKIKLELIPPTFTVTGDPISEDDPYKNLNWKDPEILISIPEYHGKRNVIKKAHSFLNEAKWTAIGLSIRLAVLDAHTYHPSPVDFKCLVLDDMLLSLDMSNRDIVLKVLLERYIQDYQLILMTHDKHFFEIAKRKINAYNQKDSWLNIEMFQNDTGRFPIPLLRFEKDGITSAKDYLIAHDYAAAAIYLRKELEGILTQLMPPQLCKIEKTEDGETKLVDKKLNDLILAFKDYCEEDGIDFNDYRELKIYKDVLLNPLAHNDVDAPIFHNETVSIIELIEKLKKISRSKVLLNSGRNLNFSLNKPDATFLSVRMRVQERLLLLEDKNTGLQKVSIYCKCRVTSTSNSGTIDNTVEQFNTIKEAYLEMCNRFAFVPQPDLSTVFTYDNKTFPVLLAEILAT